MKAKGIRVEVDIRNEKIGYKNRKKSQNRNSIHRSRVIKIRRNKVAVENMGK